MVGRTPSVLGSVWNRQTLRASCTPMVASPAVTAFYIKDRKLHYAFNWLAGALHNVSGADEITIGKHVFTVEFVSEGPNGDPEMPGFKGTATLYIDDRAVGSGNVVTQPGPFCLIGDGICVGRDSASPVTPDYADRGTFNFSGGTIDRVIVDVSGRSLSTTKRPSEAGSSRTRNCVTSAGAS